MNGVNNIWSVSDDIIDFGHVIIISLLHAAWMQYDSKPAELPKC